MAATVCCFLRMYFQVCLSHPVTVCTLLLSDPSTNGRMQKIDDISSRRLMYCTVLYCTVLTSPRCCPPRTRPRPCRAPSCASSGCSASSLSSWLNINRSCLHWSEEEREDVTINDDLENDNNIEGHCHRQWYFDEGWPQDWILKIKREYRNESPSWGRPGSIVNSDGWN